MPTARTSTHSVSEPFNIAVHGLRGTAAMMVLLAHILGGTAEHIYTDRAGFQELYRPFWNFGTYGVYLFFAISGYVILPSALKYAPREFALRRFMRLYPLFFVLTLLFVILNILTNYAPKLNDPLTILAGFTFTNLLAGTEQLTPNAWSLTYEVMFYTLIVCVVAFGVRQRHSLWLALSIAAALAFLIRFPAALYFLIGISAWLLHRRWGRTSGTAARLVEACAFVGLVLVASQGHFSYKHEEMTNPVALGTIFMTAAYFHLAALHNSLTARLLSGRLPLYLGTVSYSLYLVHPYTYLPTRLIFERLGLFGDNIALSVGVFAIAVIVTTMIATEIAHRTLETWPYRRMFSAEVFHRGSEGGGAGGAGGHTSAVAPAPVSAGAARRH